MDRFLRAVLATLVVVGLAACGDGSSAAPSGRLPEGFPSRFPIPEEAEIVSTGDVVMLHIDDVPEEVANYYERALPASGWQVIDRWQGADPHGEPTFGMVIEQATISGAISFTPTGGDGVLVRINLRQPAATSSGG